MSLVTRRPCFELLLEKLQIINVHVRNSPVVKIQVSSVQKLIPLACYRFRSFWFVRGCWPNKKVDKVFAPSVDQRCHGPVIQIIQAATNQGKSLTGKIDNRRGKIELRVQPGFDSMLIRRSDVGDVIRQKRADVTSYKLCREELINSRLRYSRQENGSNNRRNRDSCGQGQPVPWYLRQSETSLCSSPSDQHLIFPRSAAPGVRTDCVS